MICADHRLNFDPGRHRGSEHAAGDGKFAHMSIPNGQPRRPGIMDSLRSSFIPKPVDYDANEPNVLPATVKIAGWLAVVGGLLNLYTGIGLLATKGAIIDQYISDVARCKNDVGGVGAAVTATEPADVVANCKQYSEPTADLLSSANTQLTVLGIISLVIGIVLVVGGFFLTKGTRWARRIVTIMGIVLLVLVMLGSGTSLFVLISGVLVVLGLALVYVGKGATYFIRAKAEGQK